MSLFNKNETNYTMQKLETGKLRNKPHFSKKYT